MRRATIGCGLRDERGPAAALGRSGMRCDVRQRSKAWRPQLGLGWRRISTNCRCGSSPRAAGGQAVSGPAR